MNDISSYLTISLLLQSIRILQLHHGNLPLACLVWGKK